jgi:phenylalanyl-tRNA synthetase beta chain
VTREIDVVEEVMRIYGYNHIEPGKHISYTAANEEKNFDLELENRLSSIMEARGFSEIMSLSLSRETLYTDSSRLVKVLNPLSSDLNVLRGNLLYSGLEAIAYNINRRNTDLKFYETGRVYSSPEKGRYEEEKRLSLFVTGSLFNENPYGLKQEASFSYMKGVIDTLLAKLGVSGYKTTDLNNEELTGLTYVLGKNNLLSMGTVPKGLLKQFDIKQEVLYASVSWEQLLRAFSRRSIRFEEPGRFPSVRRDLALLIDRSVKYRDIEELAFSTEKKHLESVSLFDIYEDKKLGNKRSYAVRFTLADPQATLTDKQIESVMDKLIKAYKEKLGAELR